LVRGRFVPLSLARRLMIDAMYFARRLPTVSARQVMALGPLVQARKAASNRVPWAAIMAKAYAITADEFPELRRVYQTYPVPHFVEFPESVASISIERVHEDERVVLAYRIRNPSALPLTEIGTRIRYATKAPLHEVAEFTTAFRVARLPLPVRRILWWLMLNIGRQRAKFLGTFAMSAVALPGFEPLYALPTLTSLLMYGTLEKDGTMLVKLDWDHRVIDGAQAARALARLEKVLVGRIVDELRAL
jgi:hypothetical protein